MMKGAVEAKWFTNEKAHNDSMSLAFAATLHQDRADRLMSF